MPAHSPAQPGVLHHYSPRLVAFEHGSKPSTKPHSLLFIGGLTDGLGTVRYVQDLVAALEPTEWSVFNLLLSSSYTGWGMSSLDKDVEEIAQCVNYVREYKSSHPAASDGTRKIVIMGHSTGSQDVLHYLYTSNPIPPNPDFDDGLKHIVRPEVDGAILQAPVSDREAILHSLTTGTEKDVPNVLVGCYDQLVSMAKLMPYTPNKVETVLPLSMTAQLGYPADTPISSIRFLSLVSPDSPENPREDDLFSSDLTDKRLQETFGAIPSRGLLKTKLLVLYSGNDEHTPPSVDKEKLLQRWKNAANAEKEIWDSEHSGVVPGASHALSGDDEDEPRRDLSARVAGYLKAI
ncbi:hypothetical protein DTO164E3_9181 [Paecilomyces variotii]|nr:hypothetical protein DTO164E3_9181 [Paecilomyces variotii]KAJ9219866.1 hypothetical protein DTO169C6_7857 [Paecilomyces variotii]KAJ9359912.1 hypothetical protein DTO027B9_1464 [Paecilomyces variotii]KAJ9403099.1 hypothetical protein DTO045G8_9172 [Paecilomyces variotii]